MGQKKYRSWNPYQSYLLPPSPQEWLPSGHLAYFILDVVEGLDLSSIESSLQQKDPRGERPYSPVMMVSLILYAYCGGCFSSRKIAKATYTDIAFRVLTGDTHPFFTTINQFRLDHREALASLFLQVLKLCQHSGLVKLGHVSLDGTKVAANASKHKAMSYQRMGEQEKRLQDEIEALLSRADAADTHEDEAYGPGNDDEDIPAELHRREARLQRIQEAKAALEQGRRAQRLNGCAIDLRFR